jgi:hypothetical protein
VARSTGKKPEGQRTESVISNRFSLSKISARYFTIMFPLAQLPSIRRGSMKKAANSIKMSPRAQKERDGKVKSVLIRRVVFPAAILFAFVPVASAAPPAPPIGLHAAATITNDEAAKHPPVAFEATVTYYHSHDGDLFVQDGDDAIFVFAPKALKLAPGDRILVRGTMRESFRPFVIGSDITVVGHGPLPKPLQPSFEQMIRAETDCKLVTVRGVIRSADLEPDDPTATLRFTLLRILVGWRAGRGDRR